jgi:D-tyrosyl-tRNA(Tyr) deacylase
MRAVVQCVSKASVEVEDVLQAEISQGFLVYLGVGNQDCHKEAEYISYKICNLRVFEDGDGKMNLSLKDVSGQILLISQFTLYGDCRKGRRPSFIDAARPDDASTLYEQVAGKIAESGIDVKIGRFQQHMNVESLNDGPVTILLDSSREF